jgi:HTH-type transcriptional regulator/antitoxin HigA
MDNSHIVLGGRRQPIYSKIATHPGEVLKEEIEARGLIKSELARKLGIQPGHLSELFKSKRNMSASLALKLEDLLGIPAETWLTLQNRYDLTLIRNEKLTTA